MSPPTPIDLSSGIVGNTAAPGAPAGAPGAPAAPGAEPDLSTGIVGDTKPADAEEEVPTVHIKGIPMGVRNPSQAGDALLSAGETAAGVATMAPVGSAVSATYEAASRGLKPITDVALEQWQLLKSNPKLYTEWAVHQAVKWSVAHPKQAAELAGLGSGMAAAVKYLAGAGKKGE